MGGKTTPEVAPPPEPDPIPTPEQSSEPVAQAVRDSEARELRKRRGAAGTILTDPLGLDATDSLLG